MAKTTKPTAKPLPKATISKPAPPPPVALASLSAPRRPIDWLGWLYPVLLVVIAFNLCRYVFEPKEALNGDNTEYYMLGKALSSGQGYVNVADPAKTPHHHFPPGYPLLIAGLMKLGFDSLNNVKALNGFFLIGSIVLLFGQFRRLSGNVHLSFVGALLVLLNAHILEYSTTEMSEMSFLLFSLLTLVCFQKIDFTKPAYRDPWLYAFIALLAFSYHLRNVALALAAGAGLVLLYRRRWLHLGMTVVGFGLLCLPWYLHDRALGGNARVSQLGFINPLRPELGLLQGAGAWVARVGENIGRYLTREIPSSVLSWQPVNYQQPIEPLEWIVGLALLALAGFGAWHFRRDRLLLAGYALATLGILIIYPPVWTGMRLIFHLLPFLVIALLVGLHEVGKLILAKANLRNPVVAGTVLPLLFLLLAGLYTPSVKAMHQYARLGDYDPAYKNYFALAEWAKQNTLPDAVISCRKPGLFYIFADRYVTNYAFTADQKALLDDLRRRKVSYVVLDALGYSSTGRYLYPVVMANPDKFEIVQQFKEPETYLLRFHDEFGWHGDFQAGKPAGKGEYRFADGRKAAGIWEKARPDSLTGTGTLTDAAGRVLQSGRWKDGQFQQP